MAQDGAPSPQLVKERLEKALHIAWQLRPGDDHGLKALRRHGPTFYLYSDCMSPFLDEIRNGAPRRSERETTTLTVGGMVMAMYCLLGDRSERGNPNRAFVEGIFKQAKFNEKLVAEPLAQARKRATTLKELETMHIAQPFKPAEFADAIGPVVIKLGDQLKDEGYKPFHWPEYQKIVHLAP